jgi:hypothetical protein
MLGHKPEEALCQVGVTFNKKKKKKLQAFMVSQTIVIIRLESDKHISISYRNYFASNMFFIQFSYSCLCLDDIAQQLSIKYFI